jgi:4-diphosphocytidyl-2-C-methyl-D-erythritol kinase
MSEARSRSASSSTWSAPAKVNLGLRVVGRRADGYHLLESAFAPLDLADRLRIQIEPAPATEVRLDLVGHAGGVPAGPENLVVRAARAYLKAAGVEARVSIELDKVVPVGAGLGGGSSDAATTLLALSEHFANAIALQELAAIALSLGADVPFFLDPRPAWVTGVGEQIAPFEEPLPALDLVLVTPSPGLPTADVFRGFDATLTPPGASRSMPPLRGSPGRNLIAALEDEGPHLAELLTNDLEPIATQLRPAIQRIRGELERIGARTVAMSGSGPTVFGLFRTSEQARAAASMGRFDATDRVLVARTIDASARWGVV